MNAVSDFVHGYMVAILFAECDLNRTDESDDTSLESEGYTVDDIAEKSATTLRAEAVAFYWANRRTLRAAYCCDNAYTPERAGHDFYFTQAGHGVGYWDRGLGAIGGRLTDACGRQEFCCFVNDDGRVVIE